MKARERLRERGYEREREIEQRNRAGGRLIDAVDVPVARRIVDCWCLSLVAGS